MSREIELDSAGDNVPVRSLPKVAVSDAKAPFREDDFVVECMGWIAVGGAIYAPIALLLCTIWVWPTGGIAGLSLIAMSVVIGLVVFGMIGVLTVAWVWSINALLGRMFSRDTCAIAAAGLAGYVPTSIPVFLAAEYESVFTVEYSMAVLVGPVFATCFLSVVACRFTRSHPPIRVAESAGKFQMSIWHLLVVTALVAATFAIAQRLGGTRFIVLIIGWFALESMLIGIIGRTKCRTKQPTPLEQQNCDGDSIDFI